MMKIDIHHHKKSGWLAKPLQSGNLRPWLIDNGSLTARLQRRYSNFSVKPVTVKYAKPIIDESALLHLPAHKTALIREVLLLGNNPVVFAHSVLPRASLRGAWNRLGKLGNKPLGAALFTNAKVKRTPLEYKKLPRHHPISMRVAGLSSSDLVGGHVLLKKQQLWARRSVFSLGGAKILVTEVFLPSILAP
jgi:chorismate lyase